MNDNQSFIENDMSISQLMIPYSDKMNSSKLRDLQQWRVQDISIRILAHWSIMIECICATN